MEALSALTDGDDARAKLLRLVERYRDWITRQPVPKSPVQRKETAQELVRLAGIAANRIQAGIELLKSYDCLTAFRVANHVMAKAALRRQGVMRGRTSPQLILQFGGRSSLHFLLMNLPGVANPESDDRQIVDLLFFPTGGGKTESYLGLSALTLVLRRMRNKGVTGAGVSVLMRYTLRLLTLDQ